MPQITFQPSGKSASVAAGTRLTDAAREAGVEIHMPCGGKGACGKCLVRILSGTADSDSLGILPRSALLEGFVAACKTRVLDSDLAVFIPEQTGLAGGQFTRASEDLLLVRRELFPRNWQYDPLALKWFLEVPPPQLGDGLSDLDRLTRRIQREWGRQEIVYPLAIIRQAARVLRADGGRVTVTLIREAERYRVVALEPGNQSVRHYGIAVDVGTTTVAVQLVFLPLADVVGTRIDYNAQVALGLDVISRINHARRPGGLAKLRERVLETINRLLREVAAGHGVDPAEISNAVVAGNTTMVHLLLGLDPEGIRIEPYTPTLLHAPFFEAREVGIDINPLSLVYFSPCVGSYVGGDITAGLLCTDLATDSPATSLFIDIGTNGEIVLGNNEFLLACACSAGPAFEGGGIECGMRAAIGAIEKVEVDPETGTAAWQTIGDAKPVGICGSGMIALLADLFLTGWIDASGRLDTRRPSPAITLEGRRARYTIVPAGSSGTGDALTISDLDIENLLRAKAAIYAACSLMLDQVGMTFDDLDTVFIAGGFGRFLDLEKAKVIGLIPDLPTEKFQYIGNSSLMGAYMVLVSQEYRQKQTDLALRMTYLELSTDPAYMDQYTGALFLPHTDPRRFPSVAARREAGRAD